MQTSLHMVSFQPLGSVPRPSERRQTAAVVPEGRLLQVCRRLRAQSREIRAEFAQKTVVKDTELFGVEEGSSVNGRNGFKLPRRFLYHKPLDFRKVQECQFFQNNADFPGARCSCRVSTSKCSCISEIGWGRCRSAVVRELNLERFGRNVIEIGTGL